MCFCVSPVVKFLLYCLVLELWYFVSLMYLLPLELSTLVAATVVILALVDPRKRTTTNSESTSAATRRAFSYACPPSTFIPAQATQRRLNYPMRREERDALTEGTISNSGYVVRTLEAALWAFGRTTSFREGCLLVTNLGDDADTVAAIYGQVLIACVGFVF